MKLKKLCYAASVVLAACWVQNASAWPDSTWTGLGGDGLWANGLNWTNVGLGTTGVPTNSQANVQIDAANGWSVITIVAGETETPGLSTAYGTIYPEWGVTLNIYGTLKTSWYIAPIGAAGSPTIINMYDNSEYSAEGIALGYNWWFNAAPYCNWNMYGNALAGVNTLYLGGHLNMYGGTMTITNGVVDGGSDQVSDLTRYINLVNGKLILPASFTATVNDWIDRGVLFAYGKKYQSVDLVINEADPNYPGRTVVSTIPLGGSLLNVGLSPRTNMMVGTFQQIDVLGDYPSVTNVVMRYLDPATVLLTPTFQSSAPNVVSVTTNGYAAPLSPGSANITVTFGAFSGTNLITVTPFTSSLVHRYSFTESSGSTTADSVPGNSPAWDGTLNGGATLGGGQVTLDGSSGYVQLPAGIVSNMDAVTVEAWANFGTPAANGTFFAFGNQDGLISARGMNYIGFQPFTGATVPGAAVLYGRGDPGNAGDQGTAYSLVSGGVTNYLGNVQIVAVFHPYAGYVALYTNGVLAAINSSVVNPLASTLRDDPINWLGQSLYSIDPFLSVSIDEFRIYNGPRSTSQIMADYALGPNQLIGTSTSVSLSVSLSGANLMVTWPTNSALVTLMSSPVLGSGAVWSPVIGNLAVVGGKYQMAIPTTGSAWFFRLQL
jgi:hypothetical protein